MTNVCDALLKKSGAESVAADEKLTRSPIQI
jgi:hypothetical protein